MCDEEERPWYDETAVFDKARAEEARIEAEAPPLTEGTFLLRVWGAAQNDPKFIEKYGKPIEPDLPTEGKADSGRHVWWFNTIAGRAIFRNELVQFCSTLENSTLVYDGDKHGNLVKKRCISVVTLRYNGKDYEVKRSYGYGYPLHTVIFDWEENNMSCDHNRISLINDFHPGVVPEDDPAWDSCGPVYVEVVDFRFEMLD